MQARKFTNLRVVPEGSHPKLGRFMMEIVGTDRHLMIDVRNEEVIGFRGKPLTIFKFRNSLRVSTGWGGNGQRKQIMIVVSSWFKRLSTNPLMEIPDVDKKDLTEFGYPGYTLCRNGDLWSSYTWTWATPILDRGVNREVSSSWLYILAANKEQPTSRMRISTLLAKAFLPNPNGWKYIRYKDGDCWNFELDNLEWSERPVQQKTYWNQLRSALLQSIAK